VHAMQYEFTLPADYDMEVIRTRVATKGHLTDDFPGLAFKAYLVRERGVDGSPVNQYAPYYLWRTGEGMAAFLRGPGFRVLSADFGRPQVRHRLAVGFHPGPAVELTPRTAVRTVTPIPAHTDPDELIAAALAEPADRPGLHSTSLALDPERWELTRLTLWHADAPDQPGTPEQAATRYRVRHLSRPELDRLTGHP